MRIDILTLFPEMFEGFLQTSILKRALKKGLLEIKLWDLREFGAGHHRHVDDRPYGGGAGMVMRVDIIDEALATIKKDIGKKKTLRAGGPLGPEAKTILLTPSGKLFTQKTSLSLSQVSSLILVCGHYEGFDERVLKLVDEQISIGDYVLTGGELPAMVVIDAVSRHIPGVLGKKESLSEESFSISGLPSQSLLEYAQYTRPEDYKGEKVPKILLSGNHAEIKKWRAQQALKKTKNIRPDLLR
jgi:tRNA (guanine37-N1)-methyltransferase